MTRWLPIAVVLLLMAVLVVTELARPRPYDERVRLEREGAQPFDAEVLFRLLPAWLDAPVEPVAEPPFEWIGDSTLVGTATLFLTDEFAPDPDETTRILAYAARGNTVVLGAQELGEAIGRPLGRVDSLEGASGLSTTWAYRGDRPFEGGLDQADTLLVRRPGGGTRAVRFPIDLGGSVLRDVDPSRSEVLATRAGGEPVLVRVRVGRGAVVVASTPLALSNAALAGSGDAETYGAVLFGAVPTVRRVYWDEFYKPLRSQITSRLDYALRVPALRWALWLLVAGGLALVLFRGRRWQRPIPPAPATPNAQREFARVLGRLHQVHGEQAWLVEQKARAFEDALRTRLGLSDLDAAHALSDAAARRAAVRAGADEAETVALFGRLRALRQAAHPDADALVRLDRDLDAFLADAERLSA